jgi:replicative DNA helicase
MVLLLHRKSYYDAKAQNRKEVENYDEVQVADIIVAKNRNGPTRTVKLGFQPSFSRYRNLSTEVDYDDD